MCGAARWEASAASFHVENRHPSNVQRPLGARTLSDGALIRAA
jgi:hypothetical protein